ncbi:sulfotransferase [Sphingomonas sp. C3-2]|uniref:sulfotransferase family protein n=1 Tax=Sphingomonas sp. C3-2 TaxID=3062169 RepID=UPI00294B91E3|nr:sulfotransferase [Sphingomonas sp. C3-2]WOK36509.1 sulfotransferase [Sphingomonas sp. C3-2]
MAPPPARLPDFVIIGAIKAATTWVAHQLRQHPDLYLPGPEPHYFSTEYHRGPGWYGSLFAAAAPAQKIGEKSADYLSHPQAPARLAMKLPEARLIVLLRNPVDRAYSDYCMLFRRGTVTGDPERYLRTANPEDRRFLDNGLYGQHLARYLDHFPREQICTLLHEDVTRAPEQVIAAVSQHIGVPLTMAPAEMATRKNDSTTPILPLPVRRVARPFKQMVSEYRDRPWFRAIRDTIARPIRYPPLSDDLRARLTEYYLSDVENLGRLLGRDLTPWLVAPEARTSRV